MRRRSLIALGCFLGPLVILTAVSCAGNHAPNDQDIGEKPPGKGEQPTAPKLEKLWQALASDDASAAYQGIWALIEARAQSIPFLRTKLRPVAGVDHKEVARLLADLDHRRYAVREKAMKGLENMAELAEPALRRAWHGKLSAEAKKRLKRLLDQRDKEVLTMEQLRAIRAIEVLELIASPQARQVIIGLAQGVPESRITQEAKTTLQRLEARSARPVQGD